MVFPDIFLLFVLLEKQLGRYLLVKLKPAEMKIKNTGRNPPIDTFNNESSFGNWNVNREGNF